MKNKFIDLSLNKLKEYGLIGSTYLRNPEYIAEYIATQYSDKKLILFSEGMHSQEVLKNQKLSELVIGILREENVEQSYLSYDFPSLKIYKKDTISEIEFDYVILLGDWKRESINSFSLSYEIELDKILLPYKDKVASETLQQLYQQKNALNLSKEKKNVALLLAFDRKDFITVAADTLSEEFNLIKIYTNNIVQYENKYFSQYLNLRDNIENIKLLIHENSFPEILIFWISSPIEMWQAWYVMQVLPKSVKYIIATSDFYFSGLYNLPPLEIGKAISMKEELTCINTESEMQLIHNVDGIMACYEGEYLEKYLKPFNENVLYSYYFTNPKEFIVQKEISTRQKNRICAVGSVVLDVDCDVQKIYCYSKFDELFERILKQNYEVHVYHGAKIENELNGKYQRLQKEYPFVWHGFVPSPILPEELSKYDFGLVVANICPTVNEVYKVHFSSLFQARVLSYIAAGIPIIVSDEYTLMSDFVKEHQIGISIKIEDFDNLDSIIQQYDYQELRKSVLRMQHKYIEARHDYKILDFLKQY